MIAKRNQTITHENTIKEINPTQGFNTSGNLGDCKNKSMYSLGPKSMKAQGRPIAHKILGEYVHAATSLMKSFEKGINFIVDEKTFLETERARDNFLFSYAPTMSLCQHLHPNAT
jgi:hypothetical protein